MERNRQRRSGGASSGAPPKDDAQEELRRAREQLEKEREAVRQEREALRIEQEREALKKEREALEKERKKAEFFRADNSSSASGSSTPKPFEVGSRVRLQGLSTVELNGRTAKVLQFVESTGRYVVELDGGGGQKSLRGESLAAVTASSEWLSSAKETLGKGLGKAKVWAGAGAAKAQAFFAGYELWQVALGVLVVALVVGAYMQNAARYSSGHAASTARRTTAEHRSEHFDTGAGRSWDEDYRDQDHSHRDYDSRPPRRDHRQHYDDYDDGYGYGGGGGILDGLLGGFGISGQTQTYLIIGVLAVLCWKGIIPVHRMDFFQLYMLWNIVAPLIGAGRGGGGGYGYGRGYGRRRMW